MKKVIFLGFFVCLFHLGLASNILAHPTKHNLQFSLGYGSFEDKETYKDKTIEDKGSMSKVYSRYTHVMNRDFNLLFSVVDINKNITEGKETFNSGGDNNTYEGVSGNREIGIGIRYYPNVKLDPNRRDKVELILISHMIGEKDQEIEYSSVVGSNRYEEINNGSGAGIQFGYTYSPSRKLDLFFDVKGRTSSSETQTRHRGYPTVSDKTFETQTQYSSATIGLRYYWTSQDRKNIEFHFSGFSNNSKAENYDDIKDSEDKESGGNFGIIYTYQLGQKLDLKAGLEAGSSTGENIENKKDNTTVTSEEENKSSLLSIGLQYYFN